MTTHTSHYYTDAEIKTMFENAAEKLQHLNDTGRKDLPDAKRVVMDLLRGELTPGSELDPTIDRYGKRLVGYKITVSNIRSTRMKNESILNNPDKAPEQPVSTPRSDTLYKGSTASATILFRDCGSSTRVDVRVSIDRYEEGLAFAYKVPSGQNAEDRKRLVDKLRDAVTYVELASTFSTTFEKDDKGLQYVYFNAAPYTEAVKKAGLSGVLPDLQDFRAPLHLVKTGELTAMLHKLVDARAALEGFYSGRSSRFKIKRKDGSAPVEFFSRSEPKPDGNFLYLPKDAVGTEVYMVPIADVAEVERPKVDVAPIYETLYA